MIIHVVIDINDGVVSDVLAYYNSQPAQDACDKLAKQGGYEDYDAWQEDDHEEEDILWFEVEVQ